MTLDDAIFNWLQIKYVADHRPDDGAAQETYQFFQEILTDDFKLEQVTVQEQNGMVEVHFVHEGEQRQKQFPLEFVRQLLEGIENEPKYNDC